MKCAIGMISGGVVHMAVHNVIFQHPVAVLTLELLLLLCATSFTIISSYSFSGHYMFRSNWPSSGVVSNKGIRRQNSERRCT
jgi:hypothetical protein